MPPAILETYDASQDPEIKPFVPVMAIAVKHHPIDSIVNRISCSNRIFRVTAYVRRWIANIRSAEKRQRELTTEEITRARFALIRYVQQQSFQADLDALRAGRPLPKDSSLSTLRPFINEL